ncbi:acyltransferase [Rhodococcus rhodochrous]|nr:acyltransferase [Rhodococcus rhodochrous]
MEVVSGLLRRAGVEISGNPLWIAPSVHFDLAGQHSISVGDRSVISEHVTILTHDYSLDRYAEKNALLKPGEELYREAPVRIGNHAFLGIRVILMPGVEVGEGAVVGAGSIVTKNVEPHTVVAGCPARLISTTDEYWEKNRSLFDVKQRRR